MENKVTLRYTSQAIVAILATSGAFCLAQGRPDIAWMAGGHSEQVDAVAYSPDGLFVASCSGQSMDATTKLWRTSDGALVRTLTVPGLLPRSLAF
jgi:WD40 repeat protein